MKERDAVWKARSENTGASDDLVPLETLDLGRIEDFDSLLEGMAHTAFGGRRLGEAAEVLVEMVTDPKCAVVLTLSGAMTVAKMNLVIAEMLDRGWVQAVVSTGALMTHGLVELSGMSHFKARGDLDDTALFERGYNRVYDTYELESSLHTLSNSLSEHVFPSFVDRDFASWELLESMGEWLAPRGRGVVSSAWRRGVPIYVPAFSDSEMGLDLASFLIKHRTRTGEPVEKVMASFRSGFDPFRDLLHYTRFVQGVERIGIFTIGGGVPRNWAQQVSPFVDELNASMDRELPLNRFRYGVRICPEPVHWGGLSGCTYSEGVSWGKFVPTEQGGRFAEVYADATLVWPLLVKGVAQRLEKRGLSAAFPAIDLEGCGPREG